MTTTVKLRKIGNSLRGILPMEVTDELRLSEGDTLHVVTDAADTFLAPAAGELTGDELATWIEAHSALL